MAESDPQFASAGSKNDAQALTGARRRRLAITLSVPVLIVAGLAGSYFLNRHVVSTDNAYVRQDKVSVAPLVSGAIVEVAVRENELVRQGDLLFRVDPEPFRIAVAQADAQIAAAQARLTGLETDLSTKSVDIKGAREDVAFYDAEYRRQAELMQKGFTTRARFDAAQHALDDARSKLADAESEQAKARAALATGAAAPGANPAVLAAQVQKRKALLDLSHVEIRAPVSGKVSQASKLLIGQLAVQDMGALSIVSSASSYVEANFKETDLADMRVGQPAELTFDAYPGMTLKGHVASIGAGTGSEFALLPAQNANGNWVKVTQRVPVRIAIDGKPSRPLIAGLSTNVRIDTSR